LDLCEFEASLAYKGSSRRARTILYTHTHTHTHTLIFKKTVHEARHGFTFF